MPSCLPCPAAPMIDPRGLQRVRRSTPSSNPSPQPAVPVCSLSYPSPSLRLRPDVASSVDALLGTPKTAAGQGAAGATAGPPGLGGLVLQGPAPIQLQAEGAAAAGHVGLWSGDDPATLWGAGSAHPGRLLLAREVLDKVQGQGAGGAGEPGQEGQGPAGGRQMGRKRKKEKGQGGTGGWACLPCVEQLRWSEGRTGGQLELRVRLLRPRDVPE